MLPRATQMGRRYGMQKRTSYGVIKATITLAFVLVLLPIMVLGNTTKLIVGISHFTTMESAIPPTPYKDEPVSAPLVLDHAAVEEAVFERLGIEVDRPPKAIANSKLILAAPYTHLRSLTATVSAVDRTYSKSSEKSSNNDSPGVLPNDGSAVRHLFIVTKMDPHSVYEIRTSWTAATPADFYLRVHKVLNETHVSLFPPSKNTHYKPPYYYVLEVIVKGTGVMLRNLEDVNDDSKLDSYTVLYDVIIEQRMLGILPASTVLNIMVLIVVLGLASILLLPMIFAVIGEDTYQKVPEKND